MAEATRGDIVRAAWVLGLSIVASSLILGVGAVFLVLYATQQSTSAVERAADRTAAAVEKVSGDITGVIGRTFADPLQLQVGTTVAMPEPVTIQGPPAQGGEIETDVDLFGSDDKDKKQDNEQR